MVYIKIIICTLFSIIGIIMSLTLAEAQENINELIDKGVENLKLEKYDQALSYFDKALQIDPNNLRAQNNKGGVFVKIGKYEEALQYFENVLENDPNHLQALHNKIATLGKLGLVDEAVPYIERLLELRPGHIEALFTQGQLQVPMGKFEEALTFFDRILEIDPNHIKALNVGGLTLIRMEKFPEALPYFERALELDSNNVKALVGIGVVLVKAEKVFEGISYFDKAFELDYEFPGLIYIKSLAFGSLPYIPIEGTMKTEVRDSDGRLVSYTEAYDIKILNQTITYQFLDNWKKRIISRDGQDYQVLERVKNGQVNNSTTPELYTGEYSNMFIGASGVKIFTEETFYDTILTHHQNAFILTRGDKFSHSWTFFKPV